MSLAAVTVTPWKAPLSTLERASYLPDEIPARLAAISTLAGVAGTAILSTCNRTEIYADLAGASDAQGLLRYMAKDRSIREGELVAAANVVADAAAARHLFRVAAGLDSVALGEAEILGQVRTAHQGALNASTMTPVLDGLFREAVRVGRLARREAALSPRSSSLGRVAVEAGTTRLGAVGGLHVLIVGAGKIARVVAESIGRSLSLTVCSRKLESARRLAGTRGFAITIDKLHSALERADLVILGITTPKPLVTAACAQEIVAARGRTMVLVDISVPRSVEASARLVDGLDLLDLDDLRQLCVEEPIVTSEELRAAEVIVEKGVAHFMLCQANREAASVVTNLRKQAEEICALELRRWGGLNGGERRLAERVARGVAAKLLHGPTMIAKDAVTAGDGPTIELLTRLFNIEAANRDRAQSAPHERRQV
jgi:glutamyl-tRNA reductase